MSERVGERLTKWNGVEWSCSLIVSGFGPLVDTSLTTDVGWGCMIRSGQMLLCQGFIMQALGREWRFNKEKVSWAWGIR